MAENQSPAERREAPRHSIDSGEEPAVVEARERGDENREQTEQEPEKTYSYAALPQPANYPKKRKDFKVLKKLHLRSAGGFVFTIDFDVGREYSGFIEETFRRHNGEAEEMEIGLPDQDAFMVDRCVSWMKVRHDFQRLTHEQRNYGWVQRKLNSWHDSFYSIKRERLRDLYFAAKDLKIISLMEDCKELLTGEHFFPFD